MSKSARGFTLVELLVVITIIAVLSVAGVTIFTGVQKNARDSKRRSDIEAIAKAYEAGYSGGYNVLNTESFSERSLPDDPAKGDYFNWLDAQGQGFKVCASLENNPNAVCNTPSANCYCISSSQSSIAPGSNNYDPSSTGTQIGPGGSAPLSCDPAGILLSDLAGYWTMDESSGTTVADFSGHNNNGNASGATVFSDSSNTPPFGKARSFSGVSSIAVPDPSDGSLDFTGSYTLTAWIRPKNLAAQGYSPLFTKMSPASRLSYQYGLNDKGNGMLDVGICAWAVTLAAPFISGSWQHIAIVNKRGNSVTYYRNGVSGGMKTNCTKPAANSDPFLIGRSSGSSWSGYSWRGEIDDVRVYDRALSATEVQNLYNSGQGCIP